MGVAQNGWCIVENPAKVDDLRLPPFMKTPNRVCRMVMVVAAQQAPGLLLETMVPRCSQPSVGFQENTLPTSSERYYMCSTFKCLHRYIILFISTYICIHIFIYIYLNAINR